MEGQKERKKGQNQKKQNIKKKNINCYMPHAISVKILMFFIRNKSEKAKECS